MNGQKIFRMMGESVFNALIFFLLFNGLNAWMSHVHYFGLWENSIPWTIGYFLGMFGGKLLKASKTKE